MDKQSKEFIIENVTQLEQVATEITNNFAKEDSAQCRIVVKFDKNITVDDLLVILKGLWKVENECKHTIDILIKDLSYEHRYKALGCALQTADLRNPIFLSNIFCLIKGYNSFDESYFNHEQVFINDEVEFLDIFDDLEEEIKCVTYKLAEYYVSMLKTCNLTEAVENNPNAVKIEFLYEYLFSTMDVTILARVLSSVKDPAIWETKKIVLGSLNYLGSIAEKFVFTNSILNVINKELIENIVKDSLSKKE